MRAFKSSSAGIVIVLVVLILFFYLCNHSFLSLVNIATMLRATAYTGIIAVGMALCLISGMIDLSVGSTAALASVVFGTLLKEYGLPIYLAILLSLCIGLIIGSVNSYVVLKMKVTPFIATISMMFIIRGLANWVSNGWSVYPLPEGILKFGEAQPLGISWAFVAFLVLAIGAELILRFSLLGLLFRAVGSDREVARCTEVNVNQVNAIAFILISMFAVLAGIFISCMSNSGSPSVGSGWEFNAITACAIGGVSLFGYHGDMFGLFCGLLTVQVIQNGIVMIGVSPHLQTVVIGAILLGAMYVDIQRKSFLDLETI